MNNSLECSPHRLKVLGVQSITVFRVAAVACCLMATGTGAANVNLTDLFEVSATVGYGTLALDASIDGNGLKIQGVSYPRGLGAHAPSTVVYALNKSFSSFTTEVGIDDETKGLGSVVFQIYADNVLVFDSGIMRGSDPAKKASVSLIGKDTLKLVINDGGDNIYSDHGDWAGAYLVPADPNYIIPGIKIAFVGNSITQGDGLADPSRQGYPALVQKMLGEGYRVMNFGYSGRTMLKKGDYPYWNENMFSRLLATQPDIITIMLGANDSKPWNWTTQAVYAADYTDFVDSLAAITLNKPGHARHPLILPVLIAPAATTNACCSISASVIADQIIPAIRNVAKAKGLLTVDAHTPLLPHLELLPDGVHPNVDGNKVLADIFYESVVNLGLKRTPQTRWLWYGQAPSAGAPAAFGNADTDKPMLWVYPAPDSLRNGTAVIICPGGGYSGLAVGYEGQDVAKWFNTFGVSAFVLRYRLSPYRHPVELNDAKRAMRIVRYLASSYGIDTTRIGIMGFSAGGHLASTLETHFDNGNAADPDPINRKKSRPDFGVLIYPVITLSAPYTHTGSRDNLLGVPAPAALVDSLSNQKWVTTVTPPTFLAHGDQDFVVPIQNSQMFDSALKAKGILDTLVVDPGKAHGYGMAGIWPPILMKWMKAHNLIAPPVGLVASSARDPIGKPALRIIGHRIYLAESTERFLVEVFDVRGDRMLVRRGFADGKTPIRVDALSPGVYMVRAKTGEGILSGKLLF